MKKVFCLMPIFCLLLVACNETKPNQEAKLDITYINNYLPNEVYSNYYVVKYEDGKFYSVGFDVGYFELEVTGFKYFIFGYRDSGCLKQKDGDKYCLEKNKTYVIRPYLITKDSRRNVNVLHSIHLHKSYEEKIPHSFESPDSINIREEEIYSNLYDTVFTPNNSGFLSLKFKIQGYEFEPEIEVVDSLETKNEYNINFVVDSTFLGTTFKNKVFKPGDTLSIDWNYNGDNYGTDGPMHDHEFLTFNGILVGMSLASSDEIKLPSMDVTVEYYRYA